MNTFTKLLTSATLALAVSVSAQAAQPGQGYDVFRSHATNIGVGEVVPGMPGMGIAMSGQGWDAFRAHASNIGVGQSIAAVSHGYIGTSMEAAPTRGFDLFRSGDIGSL